MKKHFALFLIFSLLFLPQSHASDGLKKFHGEGEVLSVDPVYSRVTIAHAPIKGLPGDSSNEFVVKSSGLLKKISPSDLVRFEIEEGVGGAEIVKLEKTGQALPKEDRMPLGQAAQQVLEGAGTVVKTVAAPIAPIGAVANATADATTNTTGSVLKDTDSQVKHKF